MLNVKLVSNQIVSEEQVKAMVLEIEPKMTHFDVVSIVENWKEFLESVGNEYSKELLRKLKDNESIYPDTLLHFAVLEAEYQLSESKTTKYDALSFLEN